MAFKESMDIDLCLTDLIESKKAVKAKNGKEWIKIRCKELDKPDDYGNTHVFYFPQTQEQKAKKEYPQRVGRGKVYDPQNPPKKQDNATQQQKQTPPQTEEEAAQKINDSLPY